MNKLTPEEFIERVDNYGQNTPISANVCQGVSCKECPIGLISTSCSNAYQLMKELINKRNLAKLKDLYET